MSDYGLLEVAEVLTSAVAERVLTTRRLCLVELVDPGGIEFLSSDYFLRLLYALFQSVIGVVQNAVAFVERVHTREEGGFE